MKISIVQNTFRLHDNPFLDSDIYVIYIDKNRYGDNQFNFLNKILKLHLQDLDSIGITPVLVKDLKSITKIINDKSQSVEIEVFVDFYNATTTYPFQDFHYLPTWCLIDWTPHVEQIQEWFLPEGLRNHKVFKKYVHENKRVIWKSKINKKQTKSIKSNMKIIDSDSYVPLPDKDLDKWILAKLKSTKFMNNDKWYKPDTCPTTSITDAQEDFDDNLKTSKLSPFFALGVLSPLVAYNFYNREDKMGSARDQLLFREMFHSCAQMPEFWIDDFGKEYEWKDTDSKTWNNYINGNTGREDVDWAMKQLKREGWLHHLARHLVADYLTRGVLEISWVEGMKWFKETLVDHDECVNRANWMWLSGTAFSTKQRSFYHYNPDNYLKNKNKKLKVKHSYYNNTN